MAELEKVIKGLERCIRDSEHIYDNPCFKCPYSCQCQEGCTTALKEDALELLKEQEPVKQNDGSCPNCGWNFENGDLDFSRLDSQKFYCPNCGKAVKWE